MNVMLLFILGGQTKVFRLVRKNDRPIYRDILAMASLAIEFEELGATVFKDRFGLLNPDLFEISTEAEVMAWVDKVRR